MKKRYINASILILAVIGLTLGALYIGQQFMVGHHDRASGGEHDMHHYLHNQLHITHDQEEKLMEIEENFSQRKQYLEETMRIANMELAEAIKRSDTYSPEVQQAVDKIHNAMGDMQKSTLEHLFEMQPILNEEQNKKLKRLITEALYDNAKK